MREGPLYNPGWRRSAPGSILKPMIHSPLSLACPCAALLATLSLLAACMSSPPETPQQRAAYDACRSQAEQQFAIQDRSSLYQPGSTSLSPYSGQSPVLNSTQDLANQYAHHEMVKACLRGATGPAPIAPQSAPTAAPLPIPPSP